MQTYDSSNGLLYGREIIGTLYRDDVSSFDVEAGKVVIVAVILQCTHLHGSRSIYNTRLGVDSKEQRQ